MAFALFNSGAAQAYANSFQPWKANGGYDKVKSTVGQEIFTKIPFMNFQAEMEMAKAGLAGYTGAKKQKMVNDSAERMQSERLKYAENEREDIQKENRKLAISRMFGSSSAGAIAARGSTSELMGAMTGGDPLASHRYVTNGDSAGLADVYNRTSEGRAGAAGLISQ